MRIEQLIYLVKIAELGSFTAAAEHLHIAQPSISQSISSLEAELETDLLTRTRLGAEPTPIGHQVVEHAKNIIAEINTINKIIKSNRSENACVNIVAGVAAISTFLPKAIASVNAAGNTGSIHITEGSARLAEHMLSRGEIDLAIVPYIEFNENGNFNFTPLLTSHLMALIRGDSPLAKKTVLTFQDIQPYPISLSCDEYTSSSYILASLSAYGTPTIALRTQNTNLVKTHVRSSGIIGMTFDISFTTGLLSQDYDLVLRPIDTPITLTFGVLCKQKKSLSHLSKCLIQEIKREAAISQEIIDQMAYL